MVFVGMPTLSLRPVRRVAAQDGLGVGRVVRLAVRFAVGCQWDVGGAEDVGCESGGSVVRVGGFKGGSLRAEFPQAWFAERGAERFDCLIVEPRLEAVQRHADAISGCRYVSEELGCGAVERKRGRAPSHALHGGCKAPRRDPVVASGQAVQVMAGGLVDIAAGQPDCCGVDR